ncbi:MAG: phage holin family protein [Streptosporangiaceae bacterium]
MQILIKVFVTAVALAVAAKVLDGISLNDPSVGKRVLTLVVVAIIFGLVNAVLKPIIKTVGCAFYVLTLGLVGLLVNGALLLLTSKISEELDISFHVDEFWPTAVLGALIIAVVGFVLDLVFGDDD